MTKIERLLTTHREAELAYRQGLKRTLGAPRMNGKCHVHALNARAEGLAEAVAILEGNDVVDVRARVRAELDRIEDDGLTGAAGARAALVAHR